LFGHRFCEVFAYNHVAAGTSLPITSTALSRWLAPWSHETSYLVTQRAAVRFLCDRGLFVSLIKRSRFDPVISQYRSHLTDLRGLAPATVDHHLRTITDFLSSACSKRRLASCHGAALWSHSEGGVMAPPQVRRIGATRGGRRIGASSIGARARFELSKSIRSVPSRPSGTTIPIPYEPIGFPNCNTSIARPQSRAWTARVLGNAVLSNEVKLVPQL